LTVTPEHLAEARSVMERLIALREHERFDRLFRRAPNIKRAAYSSTSHIALRDRELVKMAGLP
jgi:hypothetical protein